MTKKAKILISFGVALTLAAVGTFFYINRIDGGSGGTINPSLRFAPSFSLKDAQGKKLDLEDLKGSVVIVHFWATWCPPCLEELPELLEFAKKFSSEHSGAPIKWLFVSLDKKWTDAHRVFPEKEKTDQILSVIDPDMSVSDKFGSYQFPETYVLNKRQQIVAKWVGPQTWDSKVQQAFEILIKE